LLTLNNLPMLVLHDLHDLDRRFGAPSVRTVITGHSHRPLIEKRGGVLYINPGSAGPRRFSLPISVAILHVAAAQLSATIHELL
jgi:predicted phosphodiesterase